MKDAFAGTSLDWSRGDGQVWTETDAPAGLVDFHRSHLTVTIE